VKGRKGERGRELSEAGLTSTEKKLSTEFPSLEGPGVGLRITNEIVS
jgi:hypothetical protein